jgi:hypothetical protein
VKLRDAKAQVESEQPHLRGTAKIEAIKALRDAPAKPALKKEPTLASANTEDGEPARKPTSVGEAWALLALVIIGMQVIPYFAWGSLDGEPHWFDVLHAVLLVGALIELRSAYRNRNS